MLYTSITKKIKKIVKNFIFFQNRLNEHRYGGVNLFGKCKISFSNMLNPNYQKVAHASFGTHPPGQQVGVLW